jgi:hypothetical protein
MVDRVAKQMIYSEKEQTGELDTWGESYIHIGSGTTIDKQGKRRTALGNHNIFKGKCPDSLNYRSIFSLSN